MAKGQSAVIGLGKLGSCLAACLAQKGFSVVGVDTDARTVDLINQGKAPVVEPGLDELIHAGRQNLTATQDVARAVAETSSAFIVVPTPSDESGLFTTRLVREAVRPIGRALARKQDYYLVVLVSTVLPGGTQESVVSILEQESGKRCPEDFGVCYNPEFIALGSVIHDMLNPELILIGESDARAGDQLEALYAQILDNKPAVVRTNFTNAELAKISINTYVTMKITYANILAEICERLPGGDVDVVTRALGSDTRIGPRYLKGGLGFGGPCFPRDTVAFSRFARQLGVETSLAEGTQAYNDSVPARIVKLAQTNLPSGGTVSVVGLAYKPSTPVVEESQGLEIAALLAEAGAAVCVYDPLALETARKVLGESVRYARTLQESVEAADVLILANPLPELQTLPGIVQSNSHKPLVILDCWRSVGTLSTCPHVRYLGLGLHSSGAQR